MKPGARRHLREALFYGLRFMVAVRRVPSGTPVRKHAGLLTCARLPPIRLVATDGSSLDEFGVVH